MDMDEPNAVISDRELAEWKAPAPGARDPAGEREEAATYEDLSDSLRTWARSYHAAPEAREADAPGMEAGQ
jgi:hypothetical protein